MFTVTKLSQWRSVAGTTVTAERSCPCKRPACPAIGGGSEVTFKPLVPRLSVREGFLALTSPARSSGTGVVRVKKLSETDKN
ncbi:hypothetical protein J6590_080722 [Homalodisca vitripennis]|nr:hypothetical protein J6590_080722 [Homalodisca vitripennis]